MGREKFEFPTNVTQIGSIDDDIKIYIEEFAYNYICQYARTDSCSEKLGIIVGQYIESEGKTVLLINGFIQGKYSDTVNGNLAFTEDTWEYIRTRKERYFKDFEILGWMHSQPGNEASISKDDIAFHEEYFVEPYQVALIMDSIERLDLFYGWNSSQEEIRQLNGYFIYYSKNEYMQEYMLDNKVGNLRMSEFRDEDTESESEDSGSGRESVAISYRRRDRTKKEELHQKRIINMLVGTSGIVVVLCFLMGMLLVQNSNRMNKLEKELMSITGNYSPQNSDAALVFASQAESVSEPQSEPSSQEELNATVTESITESTTQSTEKSTDESIVKSTQPTETTKSTEKETEASTETTTESATQPKTEKVTESTTKEKKIAETHTVKDGESLSSISRNYYGTTKMITKIMEYNELEDPNKIYSGKVLKLPPKE